MKKIINLQRTKFYVSSDSVLCLGKIFENPESDDVWEQRIEWITSSQSYRDFEGIIGEPTEFEWNIFPGFTTLQFCDKIGDLLSDFGQTPETFTGKILFMSMFNDISCDRKRHGLGQWSFIDPGCEKKWSSMKEDSPQGTWDNIEEKMLLEFAESGCPNFRATTPLSRSQLRSKGHGKLSIHYCAD